MVPVSAGCGFRRLRFCAFGVEISPLSTVIKKWGEIDSLKEKKEKKKPYFRGEPMTKKGDQWYVMPKDGGQWQEFAGSKDDIEWK